MQLLLKVFIEDHNTSRHQLELLSEQRRKSNPWRTCFMTVPKCIYGNSNKNNLRTIEVQIVQKLKKNEPLLKFTGSCKEESVYYKNYLDL